MSEVAAGYTPGFIAVEVEGDGDAHYWVLDQAQMDEVDLANSKPGTDYCEAMGTVIDKYGLWKSGARHSTIKDALNYMLGQKMVLVEDFSYLTY
jgi:hypothetical protein